MDLLTHHMLRASAQRRPEKIGLIHHDQRLSYAQIWQRVSGLASGLQHAGLQGGDRIGIYLEPSIAQVMSIFGTSAAGGVFVPINPLLFPDQVCHIATDCQMRGLITSQTKLAALLPILAQMSSLEFVVVVDGDGDSNGQETSTEHFPAQYAFETLCQLPAGDVADCRIDKDLAAILYTSGSTGKPKGVMLSHANIMAGSSIVSDYLKITHDDRILAVLPFSFDAGLNQLMTAFQQGGSLVLLRFVFARDIVQTLLREQITGLAGVPTLWSMLAQPNSSLRKQALPNLRYMTNTGGALPQQVLTALRQALPTTDIVLMYGLTEAFRSTYLPPQELDRRPGSMGKAIPNTEIYIVNEHGQPCQPGEVGELVHRGPTVSMGYWGKPELTAAVLQPHPFLPPQLGSDEKVCYSGDLVKMDEDGYLYFIGRRDTMIKSSGFRISPTEVEEVLFQSGWVREAAVIGVPDHVLGQRVKAFVVPRQDADFDPDALLAFYAGKMPRYTVPKTLEVLPALPKTGSGKVDYPALRQHGGEA